MISSQLARGYFLSRWYYILLELYHTIESQKLLDLKYLPRSLTTKHVPVMRGHADTKGF